MAGRIKTKYPGVYYRIGARIGGRGTEKIYYIVFKKSGKVHEEKAGRQFADDMTPSKASKIRGERIEGKRLSRKDQKRRDEELKEAEKKKYTIDRLWTEYKMNRPKGHSLRTDENRYIKHLKNRFGDRQPHELLKLDIDRLRIKLLKTLSPQTVKHILNLLTWIINYGVKNNLSAGISFHINKPSVNNLKTEDLTPDQLKKLLKVIDESPDIQVSNLMKLVLYTGMRRGECFRLKWDHIDFEHGFITLKCPKGGIDQKIPMNESARQLLKNHPRSSSEYVFPGRKGLQRSNIQKAVNKIRKKASLPDGFRPLHGLRHVYASMLASSGQVDMFTLQKLLTHKSPQMTQRYAHLRDESLKRAADLASDLITGSRGNLIGLESANVKKK